MPPVPATPWPAALEGTPSAAVIEQAIRRGRLAHSLLLHGDDPTTLAGVAAAIADRLLRGPAAAAADGTGAARFGGLAPAPNASRGTPSSEASSSKMGGEWWADSTTSYSSSVDSMSYGLPVPRVRRPSLIVCCALFACGGVSRRVASSLTAQ